jgi:hypothetical protein
VLAVLVVLVVLVALSLVLFPLPPAVASAAVVFAASPALSAVAEETALPVEWLSFEGLASCARAHAAPVRNNKLSSPGTQDRLEELSIQSPRQ